MTHISAVDANRIIPNKTANYNAVKIQINDPKTIIPEGHKKDIDDNNTYNAVNLEINRPTVEYVKKPIYQYPQTTNPIRYNEMYPQINNLPKLPISPATYQTTNFINNRTFVNAEFEIEGLELSKNNKPESLKDDDKVLVREDVVLIETLPVEEVKSEEVVSVPNPNVTTLEEQKLQPSENEVAFHGLSFKAKNQVEIVPPVEIKPEVNVPQVVSNLANSDYDVQAQQMEDIAKIAMEDSQKAVPYIVTDIFNGLIDIVKKDTSNLNPPSEEQIETRKKIIINELVKEQAVSEGQDPAKVELPYQISEGQDPAKVELPYQISEKELASAMQLSPLEQAERNKEYGLYTMAILAKVYVDEVEKHTGNVVPLTDLPGAAEIVDTLRHAQNSGVKIAALDALRYLKRPEYKEELTSLFTIVSQDPNPYVARNAVMALESFDK